MGRSRDSDGSAPVYRLALTSDDLTNERDHISLSENPTGTE